MPKSYPPFSQMLTIKDVVRLTKASTKSVRRWIERHELRAHKLNGLLRIPEDALAEFVRQRLM